jgi:hypothetical protein
MTGQREKPGVPVDPSAEVPEDRHSVCGFAWYVAPSHPEMQVTSLETTFFQHVYCHRLVTSTRHVASRITFLPAENMGAFDGSAKPHL